MKPEREQVLLEGLVAGLIGYAVVAMFFVVLNVAEGRSPFHTAALLGGALFYGVEDPGGVLVLPGPVLAYNAVHLLAFLALGGAAAVAVLEIERHPGLWYVVGFLALAFVLFSCAVLLVFARELLGGAIPWWSVAGANVLAAVAMGGYLWRAHPLLRQELRALRDEA